MQRKIVLVGPPGVGKNTLVKLAKERGIYAVDIEEIHDQKKAELKEKLGDKYREVLMSEMDRVIMELIDSAPEGISVYGAGGYGSHFPLDKIQKILLLPEKSIARDRFIKRDESDPVKNAQNHDFESIYDGFVHNWKSGERTYHQVVENTGTPDEILDLIIQEEPGLRH